MNNPNDMYLSQIKEYKHQINRLKSIAQTTLKYSNSGPDTFSDIKRIAYTIINNDPDAVHFISMVVYDDLYVK